MTSKLTPELVRGMAICDAGAWQDDKTADWEFSDKALQKLAKVIEKFVLEASATSEEEVEKTARRMLSDAYSEYVGEGPYRTYADLALNGKGSFTLCSIRAIKRALLNKTKQKPIGNVISYDPVTMVARVRLNSLQNGLSPVDILDDLYVKA